MVNDADAATPPKVQSKCGREEINAHPIGWLPWAAEVGFALKGVHRKPLMLQRFPYSHVNMLTKTGNRRPRRNPQHQRHNPGNHPGKRL